MKKSESITSYARVALEASQLAGTGIHPARAWEARAAEVFKGKPSAEQKNCPKSAFLGLAEAGLIKNVASGPYTRSVDNKRYAEAAVRLLQRDSSWSEKPGQLWSEVAEATGKKQHNGQMDVVISLWNSGFLHSGLP
jgi:hypothetical protein